VSEGCRMDRHVRGRPMLLKTSCLVLLSGAALLLQGSPRCALTPAVTARTVSGQRPTSRRPDPHAQLLDYYRRYPDRYIQVSRQNWNYDFVERTAVHSFTLRNTASVGYCDIQVSFNYQAANGKSMQTKVVKVPGILEALQKLDVRRVKVKGAPDSAETVLVSVTKATVCR
jgi:hypothetical protein